MEVVKEKEEQKIDPTEQKNLIRQEIGYRKMMRFALMEQSIINFQAYLEKMVEADFAHNMDSINNHRQAIIDKNASNPKVKLRVPSIRSMIKDCERTRSLQYAKGKEYIEWNTSSINDYKKSLSEASLKYYEEYVSILGAFAHKILEMDDPKKVLILLQLYNEGLFDKIFTEFDKNIKEVEDGLSPALETKNDPEEILP